MFRNRQGQTADEKFKGIEDELSLENIHSDILTAFPEATQESRIFLVSSAGLWLQVNFAGTRYRTQLSAF